MAKSLADLIIDVRTEIKTDPNGRIWGDSALTGYINQAILKIQSDGLFGWPANENGSATISTVGGTQEYAIPTLFGQMEFILYGSSKLNPLDFETAKIRNPSNTQGVPTDYYIRGNMIGFDPIPNGVYSLNSYFRKIAAALVASTDPISLTDDFAPAIVKYATYLAWSSPRGNRQEAEAKIADYQRELNTLTNTYLLRNLDILNYRSMRSSTNHNYSDRL